MIKSLAITKMKFKIKGSSNNSCNNKKNNYPKKKKNKKVVNKAQHLENQPNFGKEIHIQ